MRRQNFVLHPHIRIPLLFPAEHSIEKSLLKRPEELKLSKDKPIEQEKQIIDRKDQDPVQDRKPSRVIFMKQPSGDKGFDKHDSKPRTGKDHEYDHNLPGRFNFPALLES